MEEVFRVNAIAPTLLIKTMLPLLLESPAPFVINVHAREGRFQCGKSSKHIHTNMAKAALAMLTRTLTAARNYRYRFKQPLGQPIFLDV